MPETYADQLSRVRLMAEGDPTWDLSPNDLEALRAVLARLDALDIPVSEKLLSLNSQEHADLMEMFDREHKGRRLDRENKSLWPSGHIYQEGEVNSLFISYRQGFAYGWGRRAASEMSSTLRLQSLEKHVTAEDVPEDVADQVEQKISRGTFGWRDASLKEIIAAAVNAMREATR